jgi:hypothetical protein
MFDHPLILFPAGVPGAHKTILAVVRIGVHTEFNKAISERGTKSTAMFYEVVNCRRESGG